MPAVQTPEAPRDTRHLRIPGSGLPLEVIGNLARRLEHEEPGVSGSILEGLDEILLKAYRQLPILRSALQDYMRKAQANSAIATIMKAA
ncbi:MAG: hypothetical protein V3T76_02425 [candidate division NC10 bacterium]